MVTLRKTTGQDSLFESRIELAFSCMLRCHGDGAKRQDGLPNTTGKHIDNSRLHESEKLTVRAKVSDGVV